jgi:prepilin-type N-terminal cleavage/methylation domain-containing protein
MTMATLLDLHRREAIRSERGVTLVELMVTIMIMSFVLVVFLSTLVSVQNAVSAEDKRSQNNDQGRLAIEALDREIRSANVVYDPKDETPGYYRLRLYTQTNSTTRNPAPGYLCSQWQITSTNDLQTRTWPALKPTLASSWRTVASGIVNRSVSPLVPAFSADSDTSKGGTGDSTQSQTGLSRTVNIVLMVNQFLSSAPTATVRLEVAVTGRNAAYGFPTNVCSADPP